MEQTSRGWYIWAALPLLILLLLQHKQIDAAAATTNATHSNTDTKASLNKENPSPPPPKSLTHTEQVTASPQTLQRNGTVIATATATEKIVQINEKQQNVKPASATAEPAKSPVDNAHNGQRPKSNSESNMDFTDSFTPMYYVFVGLSSCAILLLIARVYRLRLSRAERKYGVQGDRANQELTPLPMAIEDVNSDEDEDHTLFEVNRHSIRIL